MARSEATGGEVGSARRSVAWAGLRGGAEGRAEGAEGILDWGDRVRVRGLVKKPELNGLIATVKDFKAGASDEEGRVVIELEELKT